MRRRTLGSRALCLTLSALWLLGCLAGCGRPSPAPRDQTRRNTALATGARVSGQRSFDAGWRFFRGEVGEAAQPGFDDSSWRILDLPHDFSIEGPYDGHSPGGYDGGALNGGVGWYRKTFSLSPQSSQQVFALRFDGVYMNSDVWLNGQHLGNHPYGYTSFEYDLTRRVKTDGSPNVLAVRVENKQPSSRWYSGSGIYRHVWLIERHPIHVEPWETAITTPRVEAALARVSLRTQVRNDRDTPATVTITSAVRDDIGQELSSQSTRHELPAHAALGLAHGHDLAAPRLWSIASPALYTLRVSVWLDGAEVDAFESPFGIRTARFDPDQGFFLNGERVKLQGVCMHHDLGALGSAINERALERQLEILKSFGTNAIRTSHNPPAPELLDLCDRMGFMVMDEAFDCWRTGKTENDYHLYFDAWAETDIKSMVRRDRNHPSVVLWSIGNEIPDSEKAEGVPIAKQLIGWVREQDSTRPITIAENKMGNAYARTIAGLVDVVGYNYFPWRIDPDHQEHRLWKILGSETSSAVRSRGVYHLPLNQNVLSHSDYQCSSYDNSVVGWGNSAEASWRIDRDRPFMAGEFIWTGFDYLGEPTPYGWPAKSSYFGIVDTAGFPKDIYYFYQSQWTKKPMVHLLPHWNWQPGKTIPVLAYTNGDAVELFLNDRSLGTRAFAVGETRLEWAVPFEPGTLRAEAFQQGAVVATDEVRTAGDPARLELLADRPAIRADGRDLLFVEARVVDAHGVRVPSADHRIQFEVQGEGRLIAVDNGNPISLEPYQASQRRAFSGKALAIVQSTGRPGPISIRAWSTEGGTNLAAGKPASTDSAETSLGNTAERALDGDLTSRWCAADGNPGHHFRVDLGKAQKIEASKIVWERQAKLYRYAIDASPDGMSWTRVVDKTQHNDATQIQWDPWSATARHVRVTVTGLDQGAWASIWELQLLGSLTPLTSNRLTIEALPR